MSEHTPGPWSVSGVRTRESGQKVLQISAADNKVYALVLYSDLTPAEHLASHADARLIAAAPDQYDALYKAPRPFTAIDDPDKLSAFIIEYADWFFKVRHPALAKAEAQP